MNAHKDYLRLRREGLVMQAAFQRGELSAITVHLQTKLQWVDRGFSIGKALHSHPVIAVAAGSLLLRATKSNRLIRVSQLFTAWEIFSIVRNQLSLNRTGKES